MSDYKTSLDDWQLLDIYNRDKNKALNKWEAFSRKFRQMSPNGTFAELSEKMALVETGRIDEEVVASKKSQAKKWLDKIDTENQFE